MFCHMNMIMPLNQQEYDHAICHHHQGVHFGFGCA